MAHNPEGVIYLEVDEDITSAVDRLKKSSITAVQMVTAKRSSLFQSVINLKLLQKAAKDSGKELVLVTSDRVALNLAGRIGVAVASQVGEAGKVPLTAPLAATAVEDEIDGGTVGDEGKLPAPVPEATDAEANSEAANDAPAAQEPDPALPIAAAAGSPETPVTPAKPSGAKAKGKGIPNIGAMQKRLLWGAAGILVIGLLFGLNAFVTSANVTLYAQGDQKTASFNFSADPAASQSDIGSAVLSAQQLTSHKTLTATAQATGTKDQGTKASGSITVSNSYDSNDHPLVAGTRFVASDGHVFRSTADAVVPGGHLCGGKVCAGQTSVSVTADQNGDDYNLGPSKYSIPGLSSEQQAGITGQGNQMQGGTSKTVKVVTADDIKKAQQAALEGDKEAAAKDLNSKANTQQQVLAPSFRQSLASAEANPAAGSESPSSSITIQVNYSILAVQKSALSELTKKQEQDEFGGENQIYDDGSAKLELSLNGLSQAADGAQKFKAKATAYIGPRIDTVALAKDIKGKKYGDALEAAQRVPSVDKADITISPGWATAMPGITGHIHITIKAATQ